MKEIGIMQGRLSLPSNGKIQSFPKETWKEEFSKAKKAGLSHIEWIFEADEWEKNPLASDSGIEEINETIKATGIKIHTVCADYFMDIPYISSDADTRKELKEKLEWLIHQVSRINVSYIDIPFVDNSRINSTDEFILVANFLNGSLKSASEKNIILTLETSLNPNDFKSLLTLLNHPNIMANYDTGNSSGIGYDCVEELNSYGKWIRTLHIKDRLINNGTKPLGTGSADFDKFFKSISRFHYNGPIILQAAREKDGNEINTAVKNREFVEKYLKRYET